MKTVSDLVLSRTEGFAVGANDYEMGGSGHGSRQSHQGVFSLILFKTEGALPSARH